MLLFVTRKNMAKKAGGIAPFEILARIHFNLQVAVCPAKIWSLLHTYHNYINPNSLFDAIFFPERGEKKLVDFCFLGVESSIENRFKSPRSTESVF